ncbi:MAG: IclR family transcriptional regulator [Pseudomonas sp.]
MDKSMASQPPKSPEIVKSAKRVLEILELFDEVQESLTLSEIAKRLGYPAPSTLGLLKSLQALDYMLFDPKTKTYCPSVRVAMLGGWIQGKMFLDGAILALMTELAEKTGETVMLGMQNDIHAQYVHTVQSAKALRYFLKPGTLRPLFRTATGLMLVAHQPDEYIKRLVIRVNERDSEQKSDLSIDEAMARINQVRRQGYAYNDGYTDKISALSILLPHSKDNRAMTIGIGGPTHRVKPQLQENIDLINELIDKYISHSSI